ncbi:MAG: TonB family protein [Betaproteobacteria bacterium]|nr:TonB family protein [Betaproteobacteria bacterium]
MTHDPTPRFGVAIVLSTIVHAVLLFGVTFVLPDPRALSDLTSKLEVVLVNSKSVTRPDQADALAQARLDGGGNTDDRRRAKSPLPVLADDTRTQLETSAAKRVEQLEQEAQRLMSQVRSRKTVNPVQDQPERTPQASAERVDTSELIQRSLEIARLEAQIAKDWDDYQKRPRRRFIGARTQEYRFAQYVEDWRIKIERIGNLNYPEAAKRERIFGSLQLTVSIKSDGTVETVELNRSSGQKVLDAAALRIVKLAAPYAPFPADIRRDTDILSITRTWIFTRSDQLVSE